MLKNKLTTVAILGGMGVVGLVVGIATMAGAQTSTTTVSPVTATVATSTTVDTPEPGDVADATTTEKAHSHAPLGGDGVVSSVNGTTIVMGEEFNEGGVSYTIDASKAIITNNAVASSISDVKVGQKIFVQGTTTGTNIVATSISVGKHGEGVGKGNDTDGSKANEAGEPASSSDASDQ